MFAPLSRFFHRQPDPTEVDQAFVEELDIAHPREPRSRRAEIVIAVCWALILVKSAAIYWACHRYQVPINPWWLIGPTLAFAALCTLVYWRRD